MGPNSEVGAHPLEILDLSLLVIVTARKRNMGQGNIFTPVCHSVHREGVPQCMLGYHPPGPDTPPPRQDRAPPPGPSTTPPRTMHPSPDHAPFPRDHATPGTMHPPGTREIRSMRGRSRILLECNLVFFY